MEQRYYLDNNYIITHCRLADISCRLQDVLPKSDRAQAEAASLPCPGSRTSWRGQDR